MRVCTAGVRRGRRDVHFTTNARHQAAGRSAALAARRHAHKCFLCVRRSPALALRSITQAGTTCPIPGERLAARLRTVQPQLPRSTRLPM
jgi:hypothetical protein